MDVSKRKLSQKELTEIKVGNEGKKRDTESAFKDRVYNWIIDRYSKNGHKFKFSDAVVWAGACYELPTMLSYVALIGIYLGLAAISFKKYGDARTVVYFMILILWRLQIQIKLLNKVNRKMGS